MKQFIWITTQIEGFHFYKDAPLHVDYLKNKHRHIFKIKIWIDTNKDREIEFITLKRSIDNFLNNNLVFEDKSCESISDDIHKYLKQNFINNEIWIEVSEDGENGSFKQY